MKKSLICCAVLFALMFVLAVVPAFINPLSPVYTAIGMAFSFIVLLWLISVVWVIVVAIMALFKKVKPTKPSVNSPDVNIQAISQRDLDIIQHIERQKEAHYNAIQEKGIDGFVNEDWVKSINKTKHFMEEIEQKYGPAQTTNTAEYKEKASTYKENFYKEMSTIECFLKTDIDQMYHFYLTNSNDFYYSYFLTEMHDRFFSSKDWSWPLYEKWRKIHSSDNNPVPNLKFETYDKLKDAEYMCSKLLVNELKDALISMDVKVNSKFKKAELIRLLLDANPCYDDLKDFIPELREIEIKEKRKISLEILKKLMLHIMEKTDKTETINRYKSMKMQFKYTLTNKYAEIAFAENPDDYPPFYPGDWSTVNFYSPLKE